MFTIGVCPFVFPSWIQMFQVYLQRELRVHIRNYILAFLAFSLNKGEHA